MTPTDSSTSRPTRVPGLVELVTNECCNWIKAGKHCLQEVHGQWRQCPYRGGTVSNERCAWFERAVLPLGSPRYFPQQYGEVYAAYQDAIGGKAMGQQRRCACGELLEPRKRLCVRCRAKARRASYRKANLRRDCRVVSTTDNAFFAS